MCLVPVDANFPHTSSTQRAFLSWQSKYFYFSVVYSLHFCFSWDLLWIDIYGFRAFCKYFLETYPGYFVSPLRISGSAVESLFSQFKHNAGGKLDACNYVTARSAHLVQQCAASHHSGTGCRDETLKKKAYNSSSLNYSARQNKVYVV